MPQLNPDPWFYIFFFSWTILLFIASPKILTHFIPNDPLAKPTKTKKTWYWPWF
uniref:ATP synthase complex subunit 8 n=1 Tax=Platypelis tuberifera TaxID=294374 RepID=A0A343VT96_9NEOB|nr:ATP synthase subunit 8 [Platypelis tuberifera]